MKIQLKNSNVLDGVNAKAPTATQMEYGELAVNYNESDPVIFTKDSNDAIIRIAGKGSLTATDVGALKTGDNITQLLNDANYIPGNSNLALNSDGSANFTGQVTLTGETDLSIDLNRTGSSPSLCKINNSGDLLDISNNNAGISFTTSPSLVESARINASGNLLIGGTLPSSPNIILNSDGAASFPSVTLNANGTTTFNDNVTVQNNLTINGTLTSNDHLDIASSKEYQINGSKVLDATSLGSSVTASSLTSVGTIQTGVWNGSNINGSKINPSFSTNVNIPTTQAYRINNAKVLDATSLGSSVTSSSLTSVGTIQTGVWNGSSIAGTKINPDFATNVNISGTREYRVGGSKVLDATSLGSSVTSSSLTSVGTIQTGVWNGSSIAGTKITPNFGSQNVITTGTVSATSISGTMRYETALTVTNNTVVNFNNLPSWAKRIKIVGYGVSFVGNNDSMAIRVKTFFGAINTGYRSHSAAGYYTGTSHIIQAGDSSTAVVYGFAISPSLRDFEHTFTNVPTTASPYVWVGTGVMGASYNQSGLYGYGTVTAGGVINALAPVTGVQIFSSLGTAFDAGVITVICEG